MYNLAENICVVSCHFHEAMLELAKLGLWSKELLRRQAMLVHTLYNIIYHQKMTNVVCISL